VLKLISVIRGKLQSASAVFNNIKFGVAIMEENLTRKEGLPDDASCDAYSNRGFGPKVVNIMGPSVGTRTSIDACGDSTDLEVLPITTLTVLPEIGRPNSSKICDRTEVPARTKVFYSEDIQYLTHTLNTHT
jgi:hypothetical protein